MDAIQYVIKNCVYTGYLPCLSYSEDKNGFVATERNYDFMYNKVFSELDIDLIINGKMFELEIYQTASKITNTLEQSAFNILKQWYIDTSKYRIGIEFDNVVVRIFCICDNTIIVFDNVYFDNSGNILRFKASL